LQLWVPHDLARQIQDEETTKLTTSLSADGDRAAILIQMLAEHGLAGERCELLERARAPRQTLADTMRMVCSSAWRFETEGRGRDARLPDSLMGNVSSRAGRRVLASIAFAEDRAKAIDEALDEAGIPDEPCPLKDAAVRP
jgi:hypothetical protein